MPRRWDTVAGHTRAAAPAQSRNRSNATGAQGHSMTVVELTRRTLLAAGIPALQYPFYYNFSRILDKRLRSGLSQETLRAEARAQIDLWVLRGLDRAALQRICREVFSLNLDQAARSQTE